MSTRGWSSSPFSYRRASSPFSSSSSTSSFMNTSGRFVPYSCSTSGSSFYGSANGYGARSTTPNRNRSDPIPISCFRGAEWEPLDVPRSAGDSISVTIRFRPMNSRKYQRGDEITWYLNGDKVARSKYNPMTAYAFDKVFGPNTTSEEVYEVAVRPIVKAAMEGVNVFASNAGTVFAYGVTSSGKTHTMHVIRKLSEGKASYIPYRDSKLTRLLQSSLSGHGHVSLEEGQVKMQSRLEEDEEAKAALMSRIQRLTKLILVSSKNAIPGYLGEISKVFRDGSLHVETENHKDSPSSAVADASGDSRHKRSSNKWKDDLSPASSTECMLMLYFVATPSVCTYCLLTPLQRTKDFNFVFYCIANIYEAFDVTFDGEMTMSDEMDLLVEQVKMLAGDFAFSTSTLKHLLEQSINDPDALKT
ncbi:hypothetical protein Ancab_017721 [Ancistrocladus abbreviatus]